MSHELATCHSETNEALHMTSFAGSDGQRMQFTQQNEDGEFTWVKVNKDQAAKMVRELTAWLED